MSIDTEDEKKENDNGGNSTSYVSKVLNNAHYNFVKDNKNFAEIVNMSLGFDLVDPETLVDCDSREIALVFDGDETEEDKELKETLVKISRELFRDNKKLGVMKSDGKYIYICIENQSWEDPRIRERINLYNAISFFTTRKKDGKRIPTVTVLAGWSAKSYEESIYAFDDYDIDSNNPIKRFLPGYEIPQLNLGAVEKEKLDNASPNFRMAAYALKIATANITKEKKMEYLENMKNLYKIVDDTAKDVAIIYSKTKLSREEVMDNGFDEVINALREEGKKEGKLEGKLEGTLECILGYQKVNKCTFGEAAKAMGINSETLNQMKEAGLI